VTALFEKIRAEFAATGAVREACDRWGELQEQYDLHPCHSPERRAGGGRWVSRSPAAWR
jgi:hypothetical protein